MPNSKLYAVRPQSTGEYQPFAPALPSGSEWMWVPYALLLLLRMTGPPLSPAVESNETSHVWLIVLHVVPTQLGFDTLAIVIEPHEDPLVRPVRHTTVPTV